MDAKNLLTTSKEKWTGLAPVTRNVVIAVAAVIIGVIVLKIVF